VLTGSLMGTRPLEGVRILDLTNVLAGPYCCYQLALMGAEVVKVERPGSGDLARVLGADPSRNAAKMGISFLAQNAAKKSVTLNLKSQRGQELLKDLVRGADVLVENFRPGVMERLGFDPAYDQIVQGVSGVMSITGTSESAPLRVGYPLADTTGGMTAAMAIAAELNANPRGAFLDVSMTDAVVSAMGWVVSNYLIGGVKPAAHGNENTTSAPSGTFATADQPINIAANRDEQWEALAQRLGRPDLLTDPAYLTREDRKANRHALRAELESVLSTKPASHWVAELNALGVPAGPVLSVPQVLDDPQMIDRGLIAELQMDSEQIKVSTSAAIIDGNRPKPNLPPPTLGQHNLEIWVEAGLSETEIANLQDEGVI